VLVLNPKLFISPYTISMEPTVLLFDLDGVLIKPGGYRAAVRATVNYFTNRLGLGDLAPDDETIAIFEAQEITCEWDMVPLLLAIALEAAVARAEADQRAPAGQPPLLDSLDMARDWLREHLRPEEPLIVDYAPLMRRMGRYVRAGEAPADSLLAVCQVGSPVDLFPHLAGQGVLAELLAGTRWLERSRTTPVFEAFALGDAMYSRATGLPAEVHTDSLIARYDRPLLAPELRARLLASRAQGRLCMAAYTARPSLPLQPPAELLSVYVPEAELALELIGIDPFPLIGSGQMGEAARRLGENEDRRCQRRRLDERPSGRFRLDGKSLSVSGAGRQPPAILRNRRRCPACAVFAAYF
jgi:hypothetical protein